MFEGICDAMHREMEKLEQKYDNGSMQMNGQDLKDIDMMAHALKCLATYDAMKGNSEYGGSYDGGSYARGRSRVTGRYISRDGYSRDMEPYPDGYRR